MEKPFKGSSMLQNSIPYEEVTNLYPERLLCAEKELLKSGLDFCYRISLPSSKGGKKEYFCKLLQRDGSRNPSEVEILSRLRHPYVVPLLALVEGKRYFDKCALGLLMPYYPLSLSAYLTDKELSSRIDQRLKISHRICLTLKDLHEQSILHLDLKSGNVMLNENYEPILIDFGSARLTDNRLECLLSKEERFVTPEISPPEVLFSYQQNEYHLRCGWYTDVWELGLLLLTILSQNKRFYPCRVAHNDPEEISNFLRKEFCGKSFHKHIHKLLLDTQLTTTQKLKFSSFFRSLLTQDIYSRPSLETICQFPALQTEAQSVTYHFQKTDKLSLYLPSGKELTALTQAARYVICFYKEYWKFAPIRALFASLDLFYGASHLCTEIGDYDDFLTYFTAAVCWLGLRMCYGARTENLRSLVQYFQLSNRASIGQLANRILLQLGGSCHAYRSYTQCRDEQDILYYLNEIFPFPIVYARLEQIEPTEELMNDYLVSDFYPL